MRRFRSDRRQHKLLKPMSHVFRERFGKEFFKTVPHLPGIYKMYDAHGELVYVGKAKDLKARLRSYRQLDHMLPKTRLMLRYIEKIEIEICESEAAALKRENYFLRTLKPFYNRANTRQENYRFLELQKRENSLKLKLVRADEMDTSDKSKAYFGCFKSMARLRTSLQRLARFLWVLEKEGERTLTRCPPSFMRIHRFYKMDLDIHWTPKNLSRLKKIKRFLRGTSRSLLDDFAEELRQASDIDKFTDFTLKRDLEELAEEYQRLFYRSKKLRKASDLGELILPEQLDDAIVQLQFSN